jgi:hypothetical protein
MKPTDPEFKDNKDQQESILSLEEKKWQQQRITAITRIASAPVLVDLARAGFQVELVSDLFNKSINYKNAIPILLHWLPRVDNLDVKESIVRALSVSWAKPAAARALVEEFRKVKYESNTGIKWTIANALSVVADDSVFSEIVDLVQDSQNGKAREMLAVSLGNMKNPNAQDILIGLLEDDEVAGHAVVGLGKLRSKKAIPEIERFQTHPKSWIRKEAKKALVRIEKVNKKARR